MKTNLVKLENLIELFSKDVGGSCCEASVFIGEINGMVVNLTVMSKREAQDSHGYSCIIQEYKCIED